MEIMKDRSFLLAGDVGRTKTLLGLYEISGERNLINTD